MGRSYLSASKTIRKKRKTKESGAKPSKFNTRARENQPSPLPAPTELPEYFFRSRSVKCKHHPSILRCDDNEKLSHTQITVSDVYDDCYSVNLQSLYTTTQSSPSEKFLKSGKSTNELVLRLAQNEYEDINILISNADSNSKIPQLNPFTLQFFIKDKVNRHTSIQNMKFTRQGKIIVTTQDPVCAAQLLNLETVVNIPVSTNVIWENITYRFLLYDIPTKVSLLEVAEELTRSNGIEIVEMRRFVKQNNTRETSPVLVTKLGTRLPGYMEIWFTNQKIQSFN
ncbi:hypothetical protein AVEN_84445-1 [Araneus ventricosus]|uniref:Uncharacterized protein n=1 Tax=Araneus ventricosus TaxID=182803 RepID=A0A4Y2S1Y1_ARAVE|nr:hypothetical protein AVEN_84445-1 [Araneus ventricosus]